MKQLLLICSIVFAIVGFCNDEKFIIKAAKGGDPAAQFRLGFYYDWGIGDFETNKTEAVKWYRKSAEQGVAEAQYTLGIRYAIGSDVEKVSAEAVKWFRKAAEQGYDEAQYCLGKCYADGIGIEKNDAEAVNWYRKAAEQGLPDAQHALEQIRIATENLTKHM